jgi:pimeloyl-ACP methyl ester carboxylesterase
LSEVPKGDLKTDEISSYYKNFLSCFVEELELNNFHLFGNSLGGWVAWDWTSCHNDKVKSLCLLASAGFEMDKVKKNITRGVLEWIPKILLTKGMPFAVARLNAKETIYDPQKITKQHILTNYRMLNKKGTLNFVFKLLIGSFVPETEHVRDVSTPTLIVWGKKDRIISVRHATMFNEAIPNSQKIIYPNCGHYPQLEFPELLLKDWKEFTTNLNS